MKRADGKVNITKNGIVVPIDLLKLTKRNIRYWCFRFQTEAIGGVPAEGAPSGLKEYFESLEWFKSWSSFSVEWDVNLEHPLSIHPVKEDPNVAWNSVLSTESKDLPR